MSLEGRGVVVTRPREMAQGLAALIEQAGGRALLFPAIEIEELPAPEALHRLGQFDIAVFVSPTAVHAAFRRIGGGWPPGLRAFAVGSGTRAELARRGIPGAIAPASGADSEALLALAELAQVGDERILIVRGEGGRTLLGDTLAARGARVEHAPCYRRNRPQADPAPLLDAWARGGVDALTVSSTEGLDNLLEMLGPAGAAHVRDTPLFAPHERVTAQANARWGVRKALVAGPSDDQMLERLVAYFSHDDRRHPHS